MKKGWILGAALFLVSQAQAADLKYCVDFIHKNSDLSKFIPLTSKGEFDSVEAARKGTVSPTLAMLTYEDTGFRVQISVIRRGNFIAEITRQSFLKNMKTGSYEKAPYTDSKYSFAEKNGKCVPSRWTETDFSADREDPRPSPVFDLNLCHALDQFFTRVPEKKASGDIEHENAVARLFEAYSTASREQLEQGLLVDGKKRSGPVFWGADTLNRCKKNFHLDKLLADHELWESGTAKKSTAEAGDIGAGSPRQ